MRKASQLGRGMCQVLKAWGGQGGHECLAEKRLWRETGWWKVVGGTELRKGYNEGANVCTRVLSVVWDQQYNITQEVGECKFSDSIHLLVQKPCG